MAKPKAPKPPQITVAGVTFSAAQVKSAVILIEGREVYIGEQESKTPRIGFVVTLPTQNGGDDDE